MIYLLIGIQGAGKTTFANELAKEKNMVIISTDMVRKNNPGIKEELVWPYVYEQVAINAKKNLDVIFDATSITPKVRKRFMDEVNKFSVDSLFGAFFFETDKVERSIVPCTTPGTLSASDVSLICIYLIAGAPL